MMQKVASKAMKRSCGIARAGARREGHPAEADVAEPADQRAAAVEGERVADQRPGDHRHGDRGDAHHEGVEGVLRAHQPGVEEPERRGHHQHQRRRDQHPGGVAGVDPDAERARRREGAHLSTGVTASASASPVRMRTARSSGTTKILPSPTSPVRAALAERVDRRLDEVVGDRDLEADLLRQAHLHRRPAVGLDPLQLAPVPLHAAHRDPAHLGAVERLQHVVGLLRPHDADHQLHCSPPCLPCRRAEPI